MRLPNGHKAVVDEAKLTDYALSTSHPVGRFKAQFFSTLGIEVENRRVLRTALLELAANADAKLGRPSSYGQKYLIPGQIEGPQGSASVISVWIILAGEDTPRFVTVYPE